MPQIKNFRDFATHAGTELLKATASTILGQVVGKKLADIVQNWKWFQRGYTEAFSQIELADLAKAGNPSIVAQNNNHAIVVTKIEIFNYTYKHKLSPIFFNIQYMNPATGQFNNTGRIQSYDFPTFRITFNKR